MKHLGIYGAGGHAKEVAWLATTLGYPLSSLKHFVDEEFYCNRCAFPELSLYQDFLSKYGQSDVVIAIGCPAARERAFNRIRCHGHSFPSLVSPTAMVSRNAKLGEGVTIFPGCIISEDVELEDFVCMNVLSSVSHDCKLGRFSTLSPHASICGYVSLGERVLVGANGCILEGNPYQLRHIGSDSRIGGGALVTNDISPGLTVVGVPARPITCDE